MRVLLVTNDRVGRKRAGPAIRCVELARELSKHHQVTLASGLPGDLELPGICVIFNALADPGPLRAAAGQNDVTITQGLVLHVFPFLRRSSRYVVVDLYDPYLLEYLAHDNRRFAAWRYLRQWHLLNQQLRQGDFFLCANNRQWDYWLGRLCALGRLTPEEYQHDTSFRKLLAVVPFGIKSEPPTHNQAVVKGVMQGISKDDILLLWAGGIWQWFDPVTVIRAMALVSCERADIKLLFLGTRHPNPDILDMPIVEESRRVARDLGVLGRTVFFREDWVPFEERQNFLLEADMGISAHADTVETRFAFRTRVLDYIWAGLPMILTEGDHFADFAARENVGRTVAPGDTEGWKRAILSLADSHGLRQEMRLRLQTLSAQFHWDKVSEPLLHYCNHPYRTERLSSFWMGLSRLLTPGYRRLLHFRRNPGLAASLGERSAQAKVVDSGEGAALR